MNNNNNNDEDYPKYDHFIIPEITSEEPVMNNKGQRCNCEDYPCCGCDPQ